eukprot:scaffold30361_cov67-Isochrysis_galbana.AAC.2
MIRPVGRSHAHELAPRDTGGHGDGEPGGDRTDDVVAARARHRAAGRHPGRHRHARPPGGAKLRERRKWERPDWQQAARGADGLHGARRQGANGEPTVRH